MIDHLLLIGTGLIGGSCALALKAAGGVRQISGYERDEAALAAALSRGIIDTAAPDLAQAVRAADCILLAVPVAQIAPLLSEIAPQLQAHTLITDVGSIKGEVVAAARAALGEKVAQFIPAHPIAGREQSGPQAAEATLFQGRRTLLCPLPENRPADLETIASLWQACGAQTLQLEAQSHDAIFAAVSHLPHLLAFALMTEVAQRADAATLLDLAGSGFKDSTRLAASSPEMWRDICFANREALLAELDAYGAQLAQLRTLLDARSPQLFNFFEAARAARLGLD